MATIDLGKIAFVNKGTYNNSTTYEKNDLVQFTDGGLLSTYLYIDSTAQSGQAPSSSGTAGSRWVYFAKGGAAGTDVGTTLTTQGDILYRDGSGLQRLPKGAAGEVLKINSGATAPEWGADEGGKVKQVVVASNTSGVTSSSHDMTQGSGTYAVGNIGAAHISVSFTPLSSSSKLIISASALQGTGGNGQGYAGIFVDNVCRGIVSANGYANDASGISLNAYYNNTNTNAKTIQFRTCGSWGGHQNTLGTRRAAGGSRATSYDGQYGNMQILEVE